jgi:hypothetical protein
MSLIFSESQTYCCHCGLDPQSHQYKPGKEEIPGQARNDKEVTSGIGKQFRACFKFLIN